MCIFTSVYSCPAKRIIRIMLVKPVIFIKYRNSRSLNRRNTSEQIPQTFEMILHLSSATHYITSCRIINSITCTACNIHSLKYMNILTASSVHLLQESTLQLMHQDHFLQYKLIYHQLLLVFPVLQMLHSYH